MKLVTSTGTTFEHEIPVALKRRDPGCGTSRSFALIGLYVGVIPVAIGLLWFPMVARLGERGLDFVLALTVGLLVFLMVDAGAEGIETRRRCRGRIRAMALLVFAAGGSVSRPRSARRMAEAASRRRSTATPVPARCWRC